MPWTCRFNFRAPVLIGENVLLKGRVRRLSPAIRTLVLDIREINEQELVVLDGEAMVQLLEEGEGEPGRPTSSTQST